MVPYLQHRDLPSAQDVYEERKMFLRRRGRVTETQVGLAYQQEPSFYRVHDSHGTVSLEAWWAVPTADNFGRTYDWESQVIQQVVLK